MPPPSTRWSPQHQALLDAITAQTLRPKLRAALGLTSDTSSDAADLDLLDALRAAPSLQGPLHWLAQGADPSGLASALEAHYPQALPPRALHHLSLVWLAQPPRRARGLLGWLWLWEHHAPYLASVAQAAAHDRAPVDSLLSDMPAHLLAGEVATLQHLGAPAAPDAAEDAARAWESLDALRRDLLKRAAPKAAAALQSLMDAAAAAAVERTIAAAEGDFAAVERALLNAPKAAADLDPLLRAPRLLIDHVGHAEALSVWITHRCAKLVWSLYKRNRSADITALFTHYSPFAKDIEQRFKEGAAFGAQGDFADIMVLAAAATDDEDARQALLRRALGASSIHRNARLALASSNLRRAASLLRPVALRRPSPEDLTAAERLINEAADLRPDHEDLASAQDLLRRAKARA